MVRHISLAPALLSSYFLRLCQPRVLTIVSSKRSPLVLQIVRLVAGYY